MSRSIPGHLSGHLSGWLGSFSIGWHFLRTSSGSSLAGELRDILASIARDEPPPAPLPRVQEHPPQRNGQVLGRRHHVRSCLFSESWMKETT
jgi:hypothetical protein